MRAGSRNFVFFVCATGCYDGVHADELLGGRPKPTASGTGCELHEAGASVLRRLSVSQYHNTVYDLLRVSGAYTAGFASDERVAGFASNATAPVGELHVEQYLQAAETIARDAVADLESLLSCVPSQPCAETYLADLARRAYRRPLQEDEERAVLEMFRANVATQSLKDAIRLAISALLQSPAFLYHVELEPESTPSEPGLPRMLGAFALASRLSYFLWDSMPDDALFEAANSGALLTEDGLRQQLDRMLANDKTIRSVHRFHLEWFGVDRLMSVEKDPSLFPDFDAELAQAMTKDVADFAQWVYSTDGSLHDLLTANITLTDNPRLQSLYGVSPPATRAAHAPIVTPPAQRAGILTLPGVMATHAYSNQTSPIRRGVLVREHLLCEVIPSPPNDVDDVPPGVDPGATTRERFAQHTQDPSCASCHVLIDPVGFGLENYDPVGAFRSEEHGSLPINSRGELTGTDISGNGAFTGGVELAGLLAQSQAVRNCVAKHWFRYALGRGETSADSCSLQYIYDAFERSGHDIRMLMRAVALSHSFRSFRTAMP